MISKINELYQLLMNLYQILMSLYQTLMNLYRILINGYQIKHRFTIEIISNFAESAPNSDESVSNSNVLILTTQK